VFSHLAASDDGKENDFTKKQLELFTEACAVIRNFTGYDFLRHIANSSGISGDPSLHLDMVRLGVGLYGVDANPSMQSKLRNVTKLRSTIAQVRKVMAGDAVGYGRRAVLQRDSLIATVRIGYADGYPRLLGNGIGQMLIDGKSVPVVGNVCMDMTMLDVTDVEDVSFGDEVIVFGEGLPITEVAAKAQTISYEIMTGISQRVKRVYYET
jgi:alanine racemase